METIRVQQPINLKVVRFELDFGSLVSMDQRKQPEKKTRPIKIPKVNFEKKRAPIPPPPINNTNVKKRDANDLIEELLDDIYAERRYWTCSSNIEYSRGSFSVGSEVSSQYYCEEEREALQKTFLEDLDVQEILENLEVLEQRLQWTGKRLAKHLRRRDRLRRQQKRLCAAFTVILRHITGDANARFGVVAGEGPGEGGFAEWLHAMRLVARLPAGVPQHFRKRLWLSLADRYLSSRHVDWAAAERACFRGTALPDDAELGAQILKDLHRTGCSLFCGSEGRENQAMLRRVLLAYARWNKEVGYCQGFNMLAAIILEVMDKAESESLKVMIYLVEAVLPEGYFADDLRGLSADMAAFRDLLRLRLPRLANHMDHLQRISDGGGVEPPLPDVFTMQWFLTLYATWLPRETLLRIWDLVLLDGNEILLLTALAIWDILQDRILSARSADDFYSCMGGGAGAIWEAGDVLLAKVVALGTAPELPRLRNIHRYRVTPPAPPISAPSYQPPLHSAMQSMTKRGLRLFYSEDEGDSSDDGNKMALATVIPRRDDRGTGDRLSLDIGALKRQYARLRERQRQAHVILAAACARHAAVGVPTSPTSLTVNNLLLGKTAIVSSRGRRLGPPPGAVPPTRQAISPSSNTCTSETITWNEENKRKTMSRRDSLKWKDIKKENKTDRNRKASIDLDETGDGIIVSEYEANEMIASIRPRQKSSESSSYSSHSSSSSDTSLCDDGENASDSDHETPVSKTRVKEKSNIHKLPVFKDTKISRSPVKLQNEPESIVLEETSLSSTKKIDSIDEYLGSAAGAPLRTYIDEFESKGNENKNEDLQCNTSYTRISPYKILPSPNKKQKETIITQENNLSNVEKDRIVKSENKRINFNELSPLELSPVNFRQTARELSYTFRYQSNYSKYDSSQTISRPPDIIDSFIKYPDFVPDLDLSDKSSHDIESLPKSPGNDSVLISEDEPPIQLKIDKYFEHSPEFFGARFTDPNSSEIPSRRAAKRDCRVPKKPDSLTLKTSHNDSLSKSISERASSLPQSHSFGLAKTLSESAGEKSGERKQTVNLEESSYTFKKNLEPFSPKEYILQTGRKNSERALQIIQENSKILSRILTKQSITETKKSPIKIDLPHRTQKFLDGATKNEFCINNQSKDLILKESTSDSVIKYRKKDKLCAETKDFSKNRPISVNDPSFLELHKKNLPKVCTKTPTEPLGNKTDLYGWENKGFLAKSDVTNSSVEKTSNWEHELKHKRDIYCYSDKKENNVTDNNRHSFSEDSTRPLITLPSTEPKDTHQFDRQITNEDFTHPLSSKYNDFVLSKASDICSKMANEPWVGDTLLLKTDNSQVSDFANVVTSSISFTYEPSADDSPTGAKTNSSDTLCQITSLDQVSTPISPKIFPNKEPATKDFLSDKSDRTKVETDGTCSAITSLLETDTLSSLTHSYPRSPSTGSYHPFPTRQIRMPKELGVKLGMYPKDPISSPPK